MTAPAQVMELLCRADMYPSCHDPCIHTQFTMMDVSIGQRRSDWSWPFAWFARDVSYCSRGRAETAHRQSDIMVAAGVRCQMDGARVVLVARWEAAHIFDHADIDR